MLVNPATSFPRSVWPALGPLLPRVPKVRAAASLNPNNLQPPSMCVFSSAWMHAPLCPVKTLVARASRAFSHTAARPQELYQAVPVALAPVLGNPLALAAFGLDRSASLPDQARTHQLVLPNSAEHSGMFKHPDFASRREEDG